MEGVVRGRKRPAALAAVRSVFAVALGTAPCGRGSVEAATEGSVRSHGMRCRNRRRALFEQSALAAITGKFGFGGALAHGAEAAHEIEKVLVLLMNLQQIDAAAATAADAAFAIHGRIVPRVAAAAPLPAQSSQFQHFVR